MGCRIAAAQAWAIRCIHEAAGHRANAFITLTYDQEHLPETGSLDHREWQLFAKKLRHKKGPFRFFMCGEYGTKDTRPHFHACLFGIDFEDKIEISKKDGNVLYRSAELERIWGQGMTSTGAVTFASAGYIARYITKKLHGDRASAAYQKVNLSTGEIITLKPEYICMSRNKGIGNAWINQFHHEAITHDAIYLNERHYPLPKFYDKKLQVIDAQGAIDIKRSRKQRALQGNKTDFTPQRLQDKETVLKAKIALQSRN